MTASLIVTKDSQRRLFYFLVIEQPYTAVTFHIVVEKTAVPRLSFNRKFFNISYPLILTLLNILLLKNK